MCTVSVNGVTIGYDDVGEGTNALVLVHGHPFDRSMWRPQIEAVGRLGWRVIVPDLRGYGESTVVPGKTPIDQFARDVAALLDQLAIRSVVIGGLSMGGQVVMEFCRLFPARVRGVLLAATFPQAETDEGKRIRTAMADRLLREGMEAYAKEVLPKMVAPRNMAALPSVAEHVLSMMQAAHPAGAAAALRGRAERPDYEATLARLDVPATIVVGDEDAFTTRSDAERMHGLLRRSALVWMEGVGHMPNLEREAEFNAALCRLLDTVTVTANGEIGPSEDLVVRLMTAAETRLIVDYFCSSAPEHLELLGVDPTRLPAREAWQQRCEQQVALPVEQRSNLFVAWLLGDRPVGFSTADRIVFGEQANMHLHLVGPADRARGYGVECVRRCIDLYFDCLQLKRLFCEPNAFNVAPNRTLQKAGFKYVKTHMTVPGPLNYHQAVTQWVIER